MLNKKLINNNQKKFYNQAGLWWGASGVTDEYHKRAKKIQELLGPNKLDILDLGAGSGGTSAAMAKLGHRVIGIEYADERAKQAKQLSKNVQNGELSIICDDFYTYNFDKKFDLVTYWDGFGIGTDSDQKKILKRISNEFLNNSGSLLIDVYSPYGPMSESGTQEELSKLPNVPESVDMIRKVHFNSEKSRWIDEWQPKDNPENSISQSLRCYTLEEFKLLIKGTGLKITQVEVNGKIIPTNISDAKSEKVFENCWSYFVWLKRS